MVNEKIVHYRTEPYLREAGIQIWLDVLIVIFISFLLIGIKCPPIPAVLIIATYISVTVAFYYRLVIQVLADKRTMDSVTEVVSIHSISEELSLAGNRTGHSYIRSFYPRDEMVDRCKIKVITDKGEKKKLRAVMSFRRQIKFLLLERNEIKVLQVTYLRRSKILIGIALTEELPKNTKRKDRQIIEKALRFINNSI